MRKDFKNKPYIYPQPVLIIATFNEDNTANAMNAAWGGVADDDKIFMCLSKEHKTIKNILNRKAFTVSIGTLKTLAESDYFGIVSGNKINVSAGFSHPVVVEVPSDLKVEQVSNTEITISGIDKQKVSEFAANIRKIRQPEPYKGKGIRYKGEYVRRKEGKKAAK